MNAGGDEPVGIGLRVGALNNFCHIFQCQERRQNLNRSMRVVVVDVLPGTQIAIVFNLPFFSADSAGENHA